MTRGERARLEAARRELRRGDALTTEGEVEALAVRFAALRRASSSADEPFPLLSARGEVRRDTAGAPLLAPRWLCHRLGLRHASAHIVLVAPNGLLLLQKRSGTKDTAPGRLDTSVGGHVGAGRTALEAAHAELGEEIGLGPADLARPLAPLGEPFFCLDPAGETVDAEVVTPYLGWLAPGALDRVSFADGEVARVVLAPPDEVWALLAKGDRVVAAGARAVLPRALDRLERGSI